MAAPNTAITRQDRTSVASLFDAGASIQKIFAKAEQSIATAIRGPVEAPALIRAALLQVSMTPALADCATTPKGKLSIVQGVMQAASLGLMVGGPAGEAALVPYKGEAKLIPMVRGLTTLAFRSGFLKGVTPVTVYEGEEFRVIRGTENNGLGRIIHDPDLDADQADDSKIKYVYAIFQLPDGTFTFDWLNRKGIERVRASSKAGQSAEGPWVNWWGEQAKKTVVKRGTKLLPLSPEFRAAVELDNRYETGQVNEPSSILDSTDEIEAHVSGQTHQRAANLKAKLVPCEACGAKPGEPHQSECPHAD